MGEEFGISHLQIGKLNEDGSVSWGPKVDESVQISAGDYISEEKVLPDGSFEGHLEFVSDVSEGLIKSLLFNDEDFFLNVDKLGPCEIRYELDVEPSRSEVLRMRAEEVGGVTLRNYLRALKRSRKNNGDKVRDRRKYGSRMVCIPSCDVRANGNTVTFSANQIGE